MDVCLDWEILDKCGRGSTLLAPRRAPIQFIDELSDAHSRGHRESLESSGPSRSVDDA